MYGEIYWLVLTVLMTALFWVPYVLNSFFVRGIIPTMMYPGNDAPPLSAWAKRASAAHHNAIENLVIFAPLVIVCHLLQTKLSIEAVTTAAMVYFFVRLIHYIVYTLKIPIIRTLSFLVGWGVQVYLAYLIITALA